MMLEINLLGRFSIRIDGRDVPHSGIEGRKARSLLKLISLQRNYQLLRDQAMEILWQGLSPESAAAQLYKGIHYIRKAFSAYTHDATCEELIEISDEMIRLKGSVETDVRRFEAASRAALTSKETLDLEYAASLYTGDLLPMDLYSEWTALPRDHLRQLYLDVLLVLGQCYQRENRFAHAAETFRLALNKDPLLETAHRNLMRVFALQGQTARAVRQFETCRQLLMEELAAQPESETVQLYEAILERRIAGPAAEGESVTRLTLPALVGRSEECRLIESAFERLGAGQGCALVFEGAIGIGKTRLVQELGARGRRRGFSILSGSAREMEGAVSYGPFIEIFGAALREQTDAEHLIPLEIARSIPGHSGSAHPVPNTDRKAAQGYLFAQIKEFFRRFTTSVPAALIIEDLHVADEGTLELFHFLARQTNDMPLLIAATLRSDQGEKTEHVRRVYQDLSRETALSIVTLQSLNELDHLVLLEQAAGRPDLPREFVESVYRLSEGNPMFAIELCRYHSGDGSFENLPADVINVEPSVFPHVPPSLTGTVGRKLRDLPAGARHLLYLMAVLGREIEFAFLETAWSGGETGERLDGDPLLFDLLDELRTAGLVEEHGLQYTFRHTLVRESVYQSISEARRTALHALAARSLLALYSDDEEMPVEQVAFHFGRAGDARQASHYLMLAGRRAESVYAHEDALRCYRQALDVFEGQDDSIALRTQSHLYGRIGDVYRASGRLEQSFEAYERALDLASSLHLSRSERAGLHLNIALVAIFRTEMDKSERHLDAAWELVEANGEERARVLVLKALHLWHLNKLEEAYRTAREALETAESAGSSLIASQACEILAMACLPMGRWEEGLAYEKRRQIHGWSPEVVVATDAHLCLWEYHVGGDRPFIEAAAFMERVSEQAERLGDYRCVAVCHYALGTMHLWRGDSEKAADELDASMVLHARVGSPAGMAYALARKAVMYTVQGALDAGWEAVRNGIEHAKSAAVRDHCLQRLYGVGLWNRLEAGDEKQVRRLVEDSEALMGESQPCSACALELYPWLAFYYLRSGQTERAEACSRTTNAFAEATGNPVARVITAMVHSSVMSARANHDAASSLRERALKLVDKMVDRQAMSPVTHFVDRMIDQQIQFR